MAEHTDGSFYVTGGTLRHDAACYVERQADKDLLDGLLKGDFCYVLTSRQMGKSSLMVRTAGKLREQRCGQALDPRHTAPSSRQGLVKSFGERLPGVDARMRA